LTARLSFSADRSPSDCGRGALSESQAAGRALDLTHRRRTTEHSANLARIGARGLAHIAATFGYDDLLALSSYVLDEIGPDEEAQIQEILDEVAPEASEEIMQSLAEQWRSEGRAEGRAEGLANYLIGQINRRFGPVPDSLQRSIRTAETDQVQAWLDELVDTGRLDTLFPTSRNT